MTSSKSGSLRSTVLKSVFSLCFLLLGSLLSLAQTVVTAPVNGQDICSNTAVGGSAPAYTTLGDIVVTETANSDFDFSGSPLTLTLNAPAGWQFNPSSTISYSFIPSRNITAIPILAPGDLNNSSLTLRISGAGVDADDAFTISGLQIQATSNAAAAGFIFSSSAAGFNGIDTSAPQTSFGNLSLSAAVTPSVSITSNPGSTFCAGTIPTFTANPTNGGLNPLYQWRINGLNSGANSSTNTFTPANLTDGDIISVVLTSNETCITSSRATSENVPITINPILPVSVSIAASETTICAGASVTFTATPVNAGNTPGYQWQVNGVNAGTNISTFTTTVLNNGDVVSVILTSDATPCATGNPATSNSVPITVNPVLVPSVSIVANPGNTICSGTSVTFTATPVNGGTPTYQWKVNGINIGTNSPTFTSTTLVNGDVVTVDMTSTTNCASTSIVTSNNLTMVVNNNLPISVSISASSTIICAGTSVTFTATPTNGGSTPLYQWQVNGVNAGTNSSSFTTSSLNNNDVVRVLLTSNVTLCATGNPATSNSFTMVVNPVLVPSVSIAASTGNIICSGTAVTFTATPVNGGTPSYQWKLNGANVGTNSPTYITSALVNGSVVTVDMISTAACTSASTATSNSISMVVNNDLPVSVSIAATATTICAGTSVTFTATPTNGGTTPVYQWQVNGVNAGTNNATFTSSTLKQADVVKVILTSNATPCATGNPATSTGITMAVNPNATLNLTSAPATTTQEICKTAGVTNITYAVTGASSFTSTGLPPGVTATLSGGVITISGIPTNSATTTYNYTLTTTGSCANVSASGSIKVFAAAPTNWNNGNQNITGPVSICPPTTNLVYTVPVLSDVQSYEWTLPTGFTITSGAGTNSITVSVGSSALVGNNQNITVTAKNPCNVNNTKTLKVNVNSFNGVTVNQSAQTVCSNGSITVVGTLTGNAASGTWTAPSGTFSNIITSTTSPITVTATYTPAILSGNVPLTITTNTPTGGGCPNVPGTATVNVAVNEVVSITSQPVVSQTVCSGGVVTLNVTASGTGLTYQWKKGGVNLVNGGNVSGATTAALSLSNVATNDNGVYSVVVSGSSPCAAVTSTNSTLTVNQIVAISTPPTSQTVCSGSPVSFNVSASGTGISYQWSRNGTALSNGGTVSGATSATLNLSAVNAADAGNYTVAVTGSSPCAPLTSSIASLTVNEPVVITAQPVISQTVCSGGTVNFSVTASGTALSYQWKKGGVNLVNGGNVSGATSSSLALANVSPSDNAVYTVVVSGASPCAPITSGNSTLTVNQAILITSQPVATRTLCSGNSVSFTVAASGTGLTYQWRKGTTNITGATSATFTLNSVTVGDAANDYNVVISGTTPCSPITSSNAALIVNEAVVITNQPVAQTLCSGSSATFNVTATGSGLTYQWKKGGVNIAGATAATLTINNISSTDGGNYSVVVTGSGPCTPVTSSVVALVVNQKVAITSQPVVSQTVCSSFPVSFSVAATGTGLTYQWYRDGALLSNISGVMSGVTAATLNISQAVLSHEGIYTVVVTGAAPCDPVTSANAQLLVNQSITIATQPVSRILCEGGNTSFTVAATGDVASYEWRRNGIPVSGANFSGANTATLTLTGSSVANSGNYDVIITGTANSCSQVISSVATLTVNRNSTISLSSASGTDTQTKCINTPLTNITYAIGGGGTGASITAGGLPAGVLSSYSGGIFTISGTPTISGNFNYTITTAGPCGNNTINGTIIVNPNATIALSSVAGTNAQTVCVNSALTNITYTIGGGGTGASITAGAFPAGVTGTYSSGVYTISGSPIVPGTFPYTITTSGSCTNSSISGTITVNPNATVALSSSAGTDAQTKCINTVLTNITYTVSGGTGASITAGALPSGVTGSYTAGVFTISGAPTTAGTFNYTVTTTGTCINNSVSGTITVNPNSTISLTSAAGTNIQTRCINTAITNIAYTIGGGGNGATITAGALPSGVSGSYSGGIFTISGTPTVAGTFNYTVTTTGSCNNISATGTITVNPNTTISLSSAAGTNTQANCVNTALTSITYAVGAGTGASITAGALPSGVTGVYNGGVFTISGTPTVSGTFNYTVSTTGACIQASSSGSIVVSPVPIGGTLSPALEEACVGEGGTITLSGSNGTVLRWESSLNGGISWTTIPGASGSTYSYTNASQTTSYRAVIGSGVCSQSYSSTSIVSVLLAFTPTTVASRPVICVGESSILTSTSGYPVIGIDTAGGGFNTGNPQGWRRDGLTSGNFWDANGNNTATGVWRGTNDHTFSGIAYRGDKKFAIANGDVDSRLESPVFSLIGQNSSDFIFYQAYNLLTTGAVGRIEISTNGGASYTDTLAEYTGTTSFGIANNTGILQSTTLSLANYIGLSNLRIRFSYFGTDNSSWAIDNITVPTVPPVTYAWTSNPSGSFGNPTTGVVTVSPTVTTTYILTTYIDGCAAGTSSVTVTVNPVPTITAGTAGNNVVIACFNAGTQTTPLAYSQTNIATGATYTITWSQAAKDAGFVDVTAALPASQVGLVSPAGVVAGTYTGNISVRNNPPNGCASTASPFSLVINPAPTLASVSAEPLCNVTSGTNMTVNLTGLLANSISTVVYRIGATGTAVTIDNINANAAGIASFQAPVTSADNGQSLTITSLSSLTSANPVSCTVTPNASLAINLIVWPGYVWTGGGADNLWTTVENWLCRVPIDGESVIIPDVANKNFPKLNVDFRSNNFDLLGNATIELDGRTLTLGTLGLTSTSTINNQGSVIGSQSSSLVINGVLSQSLKFVQTAPIGTSNALKTFTVNSSGNEVLLGNSLWVYGNVNPTAGIINSAGHLTMVSTASISTNITKLNANSDVIGVVNVQSYITGDGVTYAYRGWRSMSSPIDDSKIAIGDKKTYRQIKDFTVVTGPGGVANGFDQGGWAQPYAETIDLYYEPAGAWPALSFVAVPHIDQANVPGTGFFTWFRGRQGGSYDANISKVNAPYDSPEPVTITYRGEINKGNIKPVVLSKGTYTADGLNGYNMVGNPYPSAIDWKLVGKSGVEDKFLIVKQGGGQISYSNGVSNNGGSSVIQPGQGFLVEAAVDGATVSFTEACKSITYPQRLLGLPEQHLSMSSEKGLSFGPVKTMDFQGVLRLNLFDGKNSDETTIVFKPDASLEGGAGDVAYMFGSTVTLSSMSSDARYMAINFVPEIENIQEIKLNINAAKSGDVKLRFTDVPRLSGMAIFLKDNLFPGQVITVNANTVYDLKIDKKNLETYTNNRLTLVFKRLEIEDEFKLRSFTAIQKNKHVELNWMTINNADGTQFEPEYSIDGVTFFSLAVIHAQGEGQTNQKYSFTDKELNSGITHYRIKQTHSSGAIFYSDVKRVEFALGETGVTTMTVYPNPVKDEINIQLSDRPNEVVDVRIFDLHGRTIMTRSFGLSEKLKFNLGGLQPAVYLIELKVKNSNELIGRAKFIKVL